MARKPLIASVDRYRALPTEADMQAGIEDVVRLKGGYSWHVNDTRQCPELRSLWDTTVLLPGLLCCLEVKSQSRPFESVEQEAVALMLATVRTVACGVVRPDPRPGEYGYTEVLDILRRF